LRIAAEIQAEGGRLYLVGGWVRDAMLGLDCRDYDIEVYHLSQDALLEVLSRHGRPNLVGKAFGVIHLAMKGLHLDFSFPRTENKVGSGHRGFLVETHPDLSFTEAALRRDFTVNAMGMELPDLQLCDPYGGERDLREGILRHVGPAFIEDSLRVLRGVQFAARFRLTACAETITLCRSLSLYDLSRERIGEEFRKWLVKGAHPAYGLRLFVQVGLPSMFPAVAPADSSWESLGRLLDALVPVRDELSPEAGMRLMLAGLLSASAQDARKFLENWIPENDLLADVPPLIIEANSLAEDGLPAAGSDPTRLRRSAVRTGGLRLSVALANAIRLSRASNEMDSGFYPSMREYGLSLGIWEQAPEPMLNGKMLLSLGLKPGKMLGELIRESFDMQLEGKLSSHDDVHAWAARVIQERGLA